MPSFVIKDKEIGDGHPCLIIAEMSANHAHSKSLALEIVHAAKEAGADCIKVQTYTAHTLTINCSTPNFLINSGLWDGYNLYNLYEDAHMPWEWQAEIMQLAEKLGLLFLSTPFDFTSVDFLETLNVDFYKIASFEIVDLPLIKYIARKGKPIIMSTGMSNLSEIETAVNAIKESGNDHICLTKCQSAYPAIPEEMNLITIPNMKKTFNTLVGLSDHSTTSATSVAAVALGANVVEKHFCISRTIKNPDSKFSMEPEEFKKMVDDIRIAEKSIGTVFYNTTKGEEENKKFRKSIFVVEDIAAGETFTPQNIRVIRPGNGFPPKYYYDILGLKASRDIKKGEPLSFELLGGKD